jgi:hypothetical protein
MFIFFDIHTVLFMDVLFWHKLNYYLAINCLIPV